MAPIGWDEDGSPLECRSDEAIRGDVGHDLVKGAVDLTSAEQLVTFGVELVDPTSNAALVAGNGPEPD